MNVNQLKKSFQRLLPLVDSLGVLLLISIALTGWVFTYFFYLKQFSLLISLLIVGFAWLPILILTRFWFALENLKDIPKIAENLIEGVTEESAQTWHSVKSGKKGAFNLWAQAKKLFEIRSILNSADDIIGQYFSIGPLVNPVYLFFGALSFVGLFFLFLASALLGVLSL